jgi:hypothetical protein
MKMQYIHTIFEVLTAVKMSMLNFRGCNAVWTCGYIPTFSPEDEGSIFL